MGAVGADAANGAPVAVVTGASSGIGAATVVRLRALGFDVIAGARRTDRLAELADRTGCRWAHLDVTDALSVDAFCADSTLPRCQILVNNAGGAHGLDPLATADERRWRVMWEANVLGTMLMTRALLPRLVASGNGHVVNVGSIAAFEVYDGGSGYTAAKHGLRALTRTLRLELLGCPVRVTEVDPGMVETEFSVVRLGSQQAADEVYEGMTPLVADDVANCVEWVVTRPAHVNIDEVVVRPRDQAAARRVHRQSR